MIGRLFARQSAPSGRPRRRRIVLGAPHPTIYALGDVHGAMHALLDAEARIFADAADEPGPKLVVHLGDHVDRGPCSAQVIDHMLAPMPPGFLRVALAGNHDAEFLAFLEEPTGGTGWLDQGGAETLASYGLDADRLMRHVRPADRAGVLADAVPLAHSAFLRSLPVTLQVGAHLFVHAGIRPGLPLEDQSDEDMMWIREPFLSLGPRLPLIVVHGHTPAAVPTFGPGRIGIDTAACVTGRLEVLKIARGGASLLR